MGRWLFLLLTIALTTMSLPMAAAQDADAAVMQDPGGDVDAYVAGAPTSIPAGVVDNIDLVAAGVSEQDETFTFTLQVESLEGHGGLFTGGGWQALIFTHGDTQFRLNFYHCGFCNDPTFTFGQMQTRPVGTEGWTTVHTATSDDDITADASGLMTWAIPRDMLADQSGAAPFPGRVLNEFWAESGLFFAEAGFEFAGNDVEWPLLVNDRMPDSGVADMVLEVVMGLAQTGDAFLHSEEPFRASNGEETTFVYRVNATNPGETEHVYQFEAVGAPVRWNVQFPVPTLVLGPGQTEMIPVLVRTPFAHQHGGAESFVMQMQAVDDPTAVGRVELGVRYLEVPQPAGHHDTVFLHSFQSEQDNPFFAVFATAFQFGPTGYMNAEPDDPNDQKINVPGRAFSFGAEGAYYWRFMLEPGLRLGLDFDLTRQLELTLPVSGTLPYPGAVLEGELILYGPEEEMTGDNGRTFIQRSEEVLAKFSSDPVELNGRHIFVVTATPTQNAELVRYDAANDLGLELVLRTGRPVTYVAQDSPAIEPGGTMVLPLFEYHDPVDEAFRTLSGPILEADTKNRVANPGDLVAFNLKARDQGNAAGDYDMQISGTHLDWASFNGPSKFYIDGDAVTTSILVDVPSDARDGDLVDLIVEAVHAEDPTRRGLVRLVVEVDTDAEHADDRNAIVRVDEVQESPLPVLVGLAALGAAVAWRRKG